MNTNNNEMRYFTLAELAEYNGQDGMPVYVAMDGIVYDLTQSSLWADAKHFGMIPGKDLTINYKACHAGRPRLDMFPIVGYLAKPK
ncbi:MAG: hypothetical protein A2Y17_10960 [Clostridiales bacterium GWF2_38_85]|nr:MAG: hypothetical protein A2Y17_10960 [Clostridiales bacterium GWF2_38_85]HBL84646.1 hypothetical protein [Clostridiales bacterium]